MGAANGSQGGLAIVEEVTYGTTPVSGWIWQHPMPSTIGLRRPTIQPNLISYAAHSARGYAGKFVDGDMVVGLELTTALIGDLLGLAGAFDTDHYALAGGSAPDVNSISVIENFGGGGASPGNAFQYIHKGVKPNAIRINLEPETNSSLTLVGIGQDTIITTGGAAATPSPPAETGVFMPSDLGTVEILGQEVCLYSAVMEALVPKTGFGRRCMGGTIKEPITSDRPDVTFTLNCDLDDTTGNETSAVLAAFLSGASVGDIELGSDFILTDCILSGEFPPLQNGQIDFTISGTASSLEVYTS